MLYRYYGQVLMHMARFLLRSKQWSMIPYILCDMNYVDYAKLKQID